MKSIYLFAILVLGPLGLTGCATSQEVVPVAVDAPKKSVATVSEIKTKAAPVKDLKGWETTAGDWKVKDGVLAQTSRGENLRVYIGDVNWSNYTLTLKARKTGGKEGFLMIFGAPYDETKSWWNLGGWGNTKHALEISGVPSQQVAGNIKIGRWYDVRFVVKGTTIQCFLGGKLVQSGTRVGAWEPSYDTELWKSKKRLNLFWQNVGQGDGKGLENKPPQPIGVMEWSP